MPELGTPSPAPPRPSPLPLSSTLAHHVFQLGQPALPAVIEQAEHDDDDADGADGHQHHKERPVVAAYLAGPRLAAAGGGVVLDANLGVGGPGSLAEILGCQGSPQGPWGWSSGTGNRLARSPAHAA